MLIAKKPAACLRSIAGVLILLMSAFAARPAYAADVVSMDGNVASDFNDTAEVGSPPRDSVKTDAQTCQEMIDRIKQSDCIKPVARFLQGASISAGLAFNTGRLTLKSHDTLTASMVGILTPQPYLSFSLPTSFFGQSGWGYEFSFNYTSAVAVYQDFADAQDALRDVGTYASMTFTDFSPSLFGSIGARDRDPDIYVRAGLGLGVGWASVRGTAYFTEDGGNAADRSCHDAALDLVAGKTDKQAFRQTCTLQTYSHMGLGESARLFADGRWRFIYSEVSIDWLTLHSGRIGYTPVETNFKLAYIHDL